MKSAPASDNAANISSKSRFMVQTLEGPRLEGELPHHLESSSGAHLGELVGCLVAESKLSGR